MKKWLSLLIICTMLLGACACAEQNTPPEPPAGGFGAPPEGMGEPPAGLGQPPEPPAGGMGTPPGGHTSFSGEYAALLTVSEDTELNENLTSTETDENALLVTAGDVSYVGGEIVRESQDSTGGDNASFYGVGAAVLATGGTLVLKDAAIETDAAGGAGVFSYGDATVYVYDSVIATKQNTSGGIHVAGGGRLYAENLTVTTEGGSAAAIRSDRGSGTMIVNGGSYTSSGSGSPAVYVTADITIRNAELTATGSEALCLEGLNTVRLYDCTLSGDMPDQEQNDNTWTVILYQSMSGDSQVGQGSFEMSGGTLISGNGGLFYTTNTESVFTIQNVTIEASEDCDYFLRCTGNTNRRGWGSSGANGANCVFTAIDQNMDGDVVWDSISTLDLYLTESSVLMGAVVDDESCAGDGSDGYCRLVIDESSAWIVTADSEVTSLECAGNITDANGEYVAIVGTDGTVYQEGESDITVTVDSFTRTADLSGANAVSAYEEHSQL